MGAASGRGVAERATPLPGAHRLVERPAGASLRSLDELLHWYVGLQSCVRCDMRRLLVILLGVILSVGVMPLSVNAQTTPGTPDPVLLDGYGVWSLAGC